MRSASEGSRRTYVVGVLALAAVYYGAAKLGLELAFATASVTAVWAPTGIALAALVLFGYRLWPGVALGAFLANSWTGLPLYATAGIAAGNTLEALAGAYLLLALAGFRPSLERVRDVVALALLAGGLSTAISATIGVSSLIAAGEVSGSDFGSVWRTWWLGDMGGDLIVAPALLIAWTHWPYDRAPGRRAEALALALALGGVAALLFSQGASATFAVFPFLVWAALRFWQPGGAGAALLIAAIAVPLTAEEIGPFANEPPDEALLLATGFVGVAGISALVLAAVVAERARAQRAVEEIAGTLQESLLPARLPPIPGIEVAAAFRPAGERHIVGGDFYDVFANDDGTWTVAIGDVCGKGAEAAALTGLARHTLRAAAAEGRPPSGALAFLNEAILRQSPNDFCTVALARLERGTGAARVTLAVGGHPLPLLLRASGAVEEVGSHGSLLGVVPDPEVADAIVELGAGDALALYTDGLTDGHAPRHIVTAAQLRARLGTCAGERPEGIVAALLHDGARANGERRDDIAVLVLRVSDAGA